MLGNVFINCFTIVVVIGHRIVNRCETDVRIVREQLFRGLPMVQSIDYNCSYCDSRPFDTRTSTKDYWIDCDMGMDNRRHGLSVPPCEFAFANLSSNSKCTTARPAGYAENQRAVIRRARKNTEEVTSCNMTFASVRGAIMSNCLKIKPADSPSPATAFHSSASH